MNSSEIERLFGEHGVKPTANRIIIAETLSRAERPMSLGELETKILTIDKSSISRALKVFREQHLVHVLEDGEDSTRYELCLHHGDDDDDMHVHFFCERCHRTFCLPDTPVPPVPLPEGFVMNSINYMVKGVCDECR